MNEIRLFGRWSLRRERDGFHLGFWSNFHGVSLRFGWFYLFRERAR